MPFPRCFFGGGAAELVERCSFPGDPYQRFTGFGAPPSMTLRNQEFCGSGEMLRYHWFRIIFGPNSLPTNVCIVFATLTGPGH